MATLKHKSGRTFKKRYQQLLKQKESPYGYRKLISEKTFLKVQQRARGLGVNLIGIDFDGMELRFSVQSGTVKGKTYTVIVQLNSLEPTDIIEGKNVAEVLRSAKMKIYCTCPAHLFWGFAYKSWLQKYGLFPEKRYPRIRNPHLRGYTCKHVHAALITYPFLAASIGKKMKDYWTEEQAKQIEKELGNALAKINVNELVDEI